jgi:rsbT co-antagonist protein RsbR
MDSRRAEALTKRLLQEANSQRAKLVVLEIAGVSVMDTSVAKAVIHAVYALRLLGCDVSQSGISASVAMSLIHLGVRLCEKSKWWGGISMMVHFFPAFCQ